MKKYINVNQHIIKSNHKHNKYDPVLRVKTYKSNDPAYSVTIDGPCTIIYRPNKPLSCGAKVWIETESTVWWESGYNV